MQRRHGEPSLCIQGASTVEEIKGKYATAISYAKVIDENARAQIARMCDFGKVLRVAMAAEF